MNQDQGKKNGFFRLFNRRNILRILFICITLYGALPLLGVLTVNILYLFLAMETTIPSAGTASVGIIGGADGPTAILVASPAWTAYILPVCALVTGIAGLIWLRKRSH